MRLLFFLIFFFSFNSAFADQPRFRKSFVSDNGLYELKICDTIFTDKKIHTDSVFDNNKNVYQFYEYTISDTYLWGLYDRKTNELIYKLDNDSILIGTMSVRISDNGNNIIIIDDFSSVSFGLPHETVVFFFSNGSLTKNLTFGDIFNNNLCCISYSVSHTMWCSYFDISSDNDFVIQTYDFHTHIYSLRGAFKSKEIDDRIPDGGNIVVSEIRRISRGKYHLTIKKNILGNYSRNDEFTITFSDKEMRRIYGKFYGLFPRPKKRLNNGFVKTLLLIDNMPVETNITFPTYNADDNCIYRE